MVSATTPAKSVDVRAQKPMNIRVVLTKKLAESSNPRGLVSR
jgi:hypothetical protein